MGSGSKPNISLKGRHVPPSEAQKRYLLLGLKQPGGKLPLFDDGGQKVPVRTIRACMDAGWCEPWFNNPIAPDWMVCKLTDGGRRVVDGSEK